MKNRLSEDERKQIQQHRKVAPPITAKRQYKCLEGQTYFDFGAAAGDGAELTLGVARPPKPTDTDAERN